MLTILGVIVIVCGEFLVLRAAFAESRKWGFICLFIPAAWVVFTIFHWNSAMIGIVIESVGLTMEEFELQKQSQYSHHSSW